MASYLVSHGQVLDSGVPFVLINRLNSNQASLFGSLQRDKNCRKRPGRAACTFLAMTGIVFGISEIAPPNRYSPLKEQSHQGSGDPW